MLGAAYAAMFAAALASLLTHLTRVFTLSGPGVLGTIRDSGRQTRSMGRGVQSGRISRIPPDGGSPSPARISPAWGGWNDAGDRAGKIEATPNAPCFSQREHRRSTVALRFWEYLPDVHRSLPVRRIELSGTTVPAKLIALWSN